MTVVFSTTASAWRHCSTAGPQQAQQAVGVRWQRLRRLQVGCAGGQPAVGFSKGGTQHPSGTYGTQHKQLALASLHFVCPTSPASRPLTRPRYASAASGPSHTMKGSSSMKSSLQKSDRSATQLRCSAAELVRVQCCWRRRAELQRSNLAHITCLLQERPGREQRRLLPSHPSIQHWCKQAPHLSRPLLCSASRGAAGSLLSLCALREGAVCEVALGCVRAVGCAAVQQPGQAHRRAFTQARPLACALLRRRNPAAPNASPTFPPLGSCLRST